MVFITLSEIIAIIAMTFGIGYIFSDYLKKPLSVEVDSHGDYDYNEVTYQPIGWDNPYRFVVMRIHDSKKGDRQLKLIKEYSYRVFVTNLKMKPHLVIKNYDKRADCENQIGEAQREGISAIPGNKFKSNYAFFQLVMLSYNIWRWMKLTAGCHQQEVGKNHTGDGDAKEKEVPAIVSNTIRIARLKMLFLAAKIVDHANRQKIYYSIHDSRTSGLIDFMKYLDKKRKKKIRWRDECRQPVLKKAG